MPNDQERTIDVDLTPEQARRPVTQGVLTEILDALISADRRWKNKMLDAVRERNLGHDKRLADLERRLTDIERK